jgi:hypothetical protein
MNFFLMEWRVVNEWTLLYPHPDCEFEWRTNKSVKKFNEKVRKLKVEIILFEQIFNFPCLMTLLADSSITLFFHQSHVCSIHNKAFLFHFFDWRFCWNSNFISKDFPPLIFHKLFKCFPVFPSIKISKNSFSVLRFSSEKFPRKAF